MSEMDLRDALSDTGVQGTHWDGCWRAHLECAVARVDSLLAELDEARRHEADAWRELENQTSGGNEALRERVEQQEKALEPFARFAEGNVDENGWTCPEHRQAISVWFGPSQFRAAAAAAALSGGSDE